MSFRFALCSEVFDLEIEETIRRVADIGFDGIEIASFKIAESVDTIGASRRESIVNAAQAAGIEIVGLHWLLVSPKGLHMTTPDADVRRKTVDYLKSLVHFCADVGGKVLIFGSPKQRNVVDGDDPEEAKKRAADGLRIVAEVCEARGTHFLLEALNPAETNFLKTVEEALDLVKLVDHPNIGYMLDCKATSGMPGGIDGNLRRHGKCAGHVHANEPGGLGPGMGDFDFRPVFQALREGGYGGWVSTEPFDYRPDPDTVARTALDTLRRASSGD